MFQAAQQELNIISHYHTKFSWHHQHWFSWAHVVLASIALLSTDLFQTCFGLPSVSSKTCCRYFKIFYKHKYLWGSSTLIWAFGNKHLYSVRTILCVVHARSHSMLHITCYSCYNVTLVSSHIPRTQCSTLTAATTRDVTLWPRNNAFTTSRSYWTLYVFEQFFKISLFLAFSSLVRSLSRLHTHTLSLALARYM